MNASPRPALPPARLALNTEPLKDSVVGAVLKWGVKLKTKTKRHAWQYVLLFVGIF